MTFYDKSRLISAGIYYYWITSAKKYAILEKRLQQLRIFCDLIVREAVSWMMHR